MGVSPSDLAMVLAPAAISHPPAHPLLSAPHFAARAAAGATTPIAGVVS